MKSEKMTAAWFVLFVAVVCSGVHCQPAVAQETATPPPDQVVRVTEANERDEARFQIAVQTWRQTFATLGQKERFRRMINHAVSLEAKLQQTGDVIAGNPADRMREHLRNQVVDERELAQAMAQAFDNLQRQLLQESIVLSKQAGLDQETAMRIFPVYKVNQTPWQQAFDPLLNDARAMAREDWVREGVIMIGSSLISDAVRDAGRGAGVYRAEKGSWEDLLAGLAIEMAAEALADEVTDPTDAWATKLQADFQAGERQVLEGPNGLLACLRAITSLHQQARLRHFGLLREEER